ncbi:MAG: InlB B-repeat-containing protein, partial [Vicingaceae bacterium]|nr:InlB B-repeat-containing protein [Vicingaceae bacterium]
MFKKFVISITFLLSTFVSGFSQTTYFDLPGGGAFPAGWSNTNNIAAQPIDKSSYHLVEPGSPGDLILTSSFDLCAHTTATLTLDIGSFGSGTHNALKVEVSLDGGATYTQTYITAATTGSAEVPITPIIISPVSSTVVIRFSVDATSGRGIRMQNLKLVGNGASSCGGGSNTVTFNGNGSDGGSMSNQTASSSTALTSNSYTQTGCTFIEWNTANDGSGTSFADGATYSFSANITLYAQWNCPPGSGNCIDEDFVDFSDWTNNGTAIDNVTSHAGLAIPCRALGSGDDLISPPANNPTQLQFYQDASSGGNGSSTLVEYSLNGGTTWITCHTFNVSSTGVTETVNLTNVGGVDLSTFTGVIFRFSSTFNTWYLDDVVVTCGVPVSNTITTGAISGAPFSVMCGTSANGTVAFTSTDPFTAGNIYTAQLSDASGNFSSPTNIGTLSSTANSGTINITIPAGTVTGAGYKIRIISSAPFVTGSESSTFTITLTDGPCATVCPELTGILVDACGGAIEGINELFTFTNGSSSLSLNDFSTTFPSAGTYCNSGCGTNTWVTNPTYVAQLNTTASCPGLFVEADPIPANGKVVVFTGSSPSYNFDYSGACGAGPYYAVFANNTNTGGRFANFSSCSVRTLNVSFGESCSDAVSYDRCLLTGGATHDGDFVTYDATGNATYLNDGCTPTAILPITLINFKGQQLQNNTNLLEWSTSSEINNDFFSIERSIDAKEFYSIGEVNGAGNSNNLIHYKFTDGSPNLERNYYRLKQIDFNGEYSYSKAIALSNKKNNTNIFTTNSVLHINFTNEVNNNNLQIIDAVGRVVYSEDINSNIKINTTNFTKGIYII